MQNQQAEPFEHFIEHLKGTNNQEQRNTAEGAFTVLKDAVYAEIEVQDRGSGGQIGAPVSVAPPGDVVAREAFPAPGGGSPPVEACSVGVRSPPPPMRPTLRAVGTATWEASGTGATCL